MQPLEGLLIQGGLSAQDPGELHAEQAEVSAAVDQRVTLVVAGQHPVATGGRPCRRDDECEAQSSCDIQYTSNGAFCNELTSLPGKETSSLAGTAGSLTLAVPTTEPMVPSSLKKKERPEFSHAFPRSSSIFKFLTFTPLFTEFLLFMNLKPY